MNWEYDKLLQHLLVLLEILWLCIHLDYISWAPKKGQYYAFTHGLLWPELSCLIDLMGCARPCGVIYMPHVLFISIWSYEAPFLPSSLLQTFFSPESIWISSTWLFTYPRFLSNLVQVIELTTRLVKLCQVCLTYTNMHVVAWPHATTPLNSSSFAYFCYGIRMWMTSRSQMQMSRSMTQSPKTYNKERIWLICETIPRNSITAFTLFSILLYQSLVKYWEANQILNL